MLPPSDIDPDDFPPGPTGMARYLEARIDELEGQKRETRGREERPPINKQIHTCRDLLRWCVTRAGYKHARMKSTLRNLGDSQYE